MDYACWIYNRAPTESTIFSHYTLWNRSIYTTHKYLLSIFHVFGAPNYVSDPKLHNSGVKIPKYQPRSNKTVFMGFRYIHLTKTTLVLNTKIKSIYPCVHMVFD